MEAVNLNEKSFSATSKFVSYTIEMECANNQKQNLEFSTLSFSFADSQLK